VPLIIHRPSHIVIGFAAQDGVVRVCRSLDKRRINLLVFLSRYRASVHVVSGNRRTAGFPGQPGRMRLVRRLLSERCRLSRSRSNVPARKSHSLAIERQCGVSVQNRKEISRPGREARVLLSVRQSGAEQQKKATAETAHDSNSSSLPCDCQPNYYRWEVSV
jgi:hypothetical protein